MFWKQKINIINVKVHYSRQYQTINLDHKMIKKGKHGRQETRQKEERSKQKLVNIDKNQNVNWKRGLINMYENDKQITNVISNILTLYVGTK